MTAFLNSLLTTLLYVGGLLIIAAGVTPLIDRFVDHPASKIFIIVFCIISFVTGIMFFVMKFDYGRSVLFIFISAGTLYILRPHLKKEM